MVTDPAETLTVGELRERLQDFDDDLRVAAEGDYKYGRVGDVREIESVPGAEVLLVNVWTAAEHPQEDGDV